MFTEVIPVIGGDPYTFLNQMAADKSVRATRLAFVVDVNVFGVDYTFFFLLLLACAVGSRCGSRASARGRACARSTLRLRRLVHLLSQLVRGLSQALARLVHSLLGAGFEGLLRVGHSVLDIAALRAGDLVAVLAEHLLDAVDHRVELVAGLDFLAALF